MHLESSAPTRIDLAGGTLDIWPLYLYHDGAQTLNAAISLRASCSVSPRDTDGLELRSEDTGATLKVGHWSELRGQTELPLLGRILEFFRPSRLRLTARSAAPVGSGIGGSSALNIAVCGALARWQGTELSDDDLVEVAMNVEAQAINVPTGTQDYRSALHGGISAVELAVDGVRRVPLAVDPEELERRIVLAYTGASRNSGINNWDVTKRHIDGDRDVFDQFERIRDVAAALREALVRHDWAEVGQQIALEWEHRKRLAPGVTTDTIERLIAGARRAGATAAKVCGAGGGGCLFCLAEPNDVQAVRAALAAEGAQLLHCGVDRAGLQINSA